MFKNFSPSALSVSGTQSELIELCLSHGFRGMDLNLVSLVDQVKLRGLPYSRRLLDSAKLLMGPFSLPMNWQADDAAFRKDLGQVATWAEVARDVGALRAVTTLQPASDENPYHQNFELYRQRLSDLGAVLQGYGIRVGVDFLAPAHHRKDKAFEFIHTFDALTTLISMVNKPAIGVSVDLWHLHIGGGTIDQLKKLKAEQIVAVSLADAPSDLDASNAVEEKRLLPGATGIVPAAAALTILAELGYDGPVTPRPHPKQMAGQRRDASVRAASQSLDEIWREAEINTTSELTPPVAS